MKSEAFVRAILGPVGSGKSTGCLMELMRRIQEQTPGPDGIRRSRWAIIRQTLQQIKLTVLKEFYTWVAPIAEFKVSDNTIYINFNDVSAEIHLIPLDDERDQRRLLSMQLTGAWINEFPEIDHNIIPSLCGRLGRYPSSANGGATWFGLIMDGNAPTINGDWWRVLEEERPPDWDLWRQPSGLSEEAENLNWLTQTPETLKLPIDHPKRLAQGRLYYERLARGQNEQWIKRYIEAEYGDDPSGSGVFKDSFEGSFHIADEIEPVHGHPLLVGLDFGRDPSAVICQYDHRGRLLVLEEVIGEDIGLQPQIEQALRPALLDERYLGKSIAIVGDPAGMQRSTLYEETSFDLLRRAGFTAFPAPTNDIDRRLRAVEALLLTHRDGDPAIIFDRERCPHLIRGLSGGYRFAKLRTGQLKPTPEKNQYSHIADALQYVCLVVHGGMNGMIASRLAGAVRSRPLKRVPTGAWT